MPHTNEDGEEFFNLFDKADLALFDASIDALAETRDIDPDDNQLKHYWTRGEGLAKWVDHPHPWTTLRNHLRKHVGPGRADRIASEWFHDVFGIWPGERKGSNPVGPG